MEKISPIPFDERLRPDAWMGWTQAIERKDEGHGPILEVRQDDQAIHLTPRLAKELMGLFQMWDEHRRGTLVRMVAPQ